METTNVMRAVDLFSGVGGVTCGYKAAGVQVIGAVDNDEPSRKTYAANHPEVKLLEDDISTLTAHALMDALGLASGALDILTACAPCQTFSTIGMKNRKENDPRNDLIERVADFVEALFPQALVMENVPQLLNDDRLKRVVDRLHKQGYGVWRGIVDMSQFWIPQYRRRMVLLALMGWKDTEVPRLAVDNPFLAHYLGRKTVRDTFEKDLTKVVKGDELNRPRTTYPDLIARRIAAIPINGGSRHALPLDLQLECHKRLTKKTRGASNVYGRLKWDAPGPTLTTRCVTPSCGRFLHPEENRAITLREAACLQTFPPSYTFKGTTLQIQAQIGNAVPPRLAQIIATLVIEALKEKGDRTK